MNAKEMAELADKNEENWTHPDYKQLDSSIKCRASGGYHYISFNLSKYSVDFLAAKDHYQRLGFTFHELPGGGTYMFW